jgi:hypothetical protein
MERPADAHRRETSGGHAGHPQFSQRPLDHAYRPARQGAFSVQLDPRGESDAIAENMRMHRPDSPQDATIGPSSSLPAVPGPRPPCTSTLSSYRSISAPSAVATRIAASESAHQVGLVMVERPGAIAAQAMALCIALLEAGARMLPPTADGSTERVNDGLH